MEGRPISNVFDTPRTAIHTPLPLDNDDAFILEPPRASHLFSDSSRTSYAPSTALQSNNNSGALLPAVGKAESDEFANERSRPTKTSRKPLIFALALAGIAVVVLAVVLPIYFTVIKPKQRNTIASTSSPSGAGGGTTGGGGGGNTGSSRVTSGGDGSTVTMNDGSTFTYSNKFGGFCTSS
jgi:glucan 1,3-beta-glucosidase